MFIVVFTLMALAEIGLLLAVGWLVRRLCRRRLKSGAARRAVVRASMWEFGGDVAHDIACGAEPEDALDEWDIGGDRVPPYDPER